MRWAQTIVACLFLFCSAIPIATQAQQPSAEYKSLQELATQLYPAGQFAQALQVSEQALPNLIRPSRIRPITEF